MAEIFMVGGAVRDLHMGVEPKDRDFVVIGSNHEEMVQNGFVRVGEDFPVYLDSKGEEYSLARKEISTGEGYVDFAFETDNVSIGDDLFRRDLTINAIALKQVEDENSPERRIYDPYNGISDIKDKIFRPVSDHFMEDPVRVLRVARLRARFGSEWKLAPELFVMVRKMAKGGVLSSLQKDRVWKEMSRAIMEPFPRLFFDTLLELDALHVVFPEIYKMLTSLEPRMFHPEGNTYEHTMMVLTQATNFGYGIETRFAAIMHDIGKTVTPFDKMPSHFGHDVKGVPLVEAFGEKYSVPKNMTKMAMFATRCHMYGHKLKEMNSKTLVKMFESINLNHDRIEYVTVLKNIFESDERGRIGYENCNVEDKKVILDYANTYMSVKFANVFPNGETNVNKIKNGMYRARISAIAKVSD